MNVTRSLIILVSLTALIAACSDATDQDGLAQPIDAGGWQSGDAIASPDTTGPTGAWEISTVDTTVTPANLTAGATAQVVCAAMDTEGNAVDTAGATAAATPADGVTFDGMTATFTSAGTYQVACTVGAVTDDTPVEVIVVAGNPSEVSITLDPEMIEAGGTANVLCNITDDQGNEVTAGGTISAPEGVTVDQSAQTVSSTVAGVYDISCAVAGAGSASAPLTVAMGPTTGLKLILSPEADRYDVGQGITVSGVVVDDYDNEGPTALSNLQANLAGAEAGFDSTGLYNMAGDDTTHIFLFQADGNYEIYAHVEGNPALEATRTVHVDSFGPIIEITAPLGAGSEGEGNAAYDGRGTYIVGEPTVYVEGSVSDTPGGLDEEEGLIIWINGELAPAGIFEVDKGGFAGDVPLVYGINHITFQSSDIHGHTTSWTIAVLWSSDYYALNPPSVETDAITDALTLHISQDVLDDGVHDHTKLDDLATICEVILAGTDVAAELGDVVLWTTTYELNLLGLATLPIELNIKPGTFVLEDPKVSLQLGDGTLTATLEANDVNVGVTLEASTGVDVAGGTVTGSGETTGVISFSTLKIASTLELGIDPATGELTVATTASTLEYGDVDGAFEPIDFSYNVSGAALMLAFSLAGQPTSGTIPFPLDDLNAEIVGIFDTLEDIEPVVGLIAPLLVEYLVPNLLNSVASTVEVDQTLDFPPLVDAEGVNGMSMDLDVAMTDVVCTPDYILLTGGGMVAASDSTPPREDFPGSIDFNGCSEPQVVGLGDAGAKVGIHDDFFNQLLYGIWAGQLLDFDLDSTGAGQLMESIGDDLPIALNLAGLNLEPLLPFVFNGCGGELMLQIGDLYVGAILGVLGKESEFGVWINGNIVVSVTANQTFACSDDTLLNEDDCVDEGAMWQVTGTALGLSVAGYDDLAIDVVVNTGLMEGDDDSLKTLLGDQLMPMLFDEVLAEAGNFELPQVELDNFGEAIPEGTALTLNVGSVEHGGEACDDDTPCAAGTACVSGVCVSAYTAIEGDLQ